MTAKEYLKKVTQAESDMKTLRARLQHYEDMGLSITSHLTDTPVSRSKGPSRVESAAVGMVDTIEAINAKLRAYEAIVRDAEKLIEKVPQERYRKILNLRYLAGMSFRSIGDELRYNDRNSIYRAHGWALWELDHVLQEEGMGE